MATAQTATHANDQGKPGVASPAADNSDMNARDKGTASQTPQKQSNARSDRTLLAEARKAVVKDESLSTTAHNVKILVKNGVVTLRGPVKSAEEKTKVEELIKPLAGVNSIANKLDIKTN
ncbi:hyperosmotically inducible protein [Janthinobacterium sp. PC23-8]|nr:hyperosmotically inducible protein [Janthinobacterium sp. PC23-8]